MVKRLVNWILEESSVRHLVRISRKLVIPGFDGMPLYDVLAFFIRSLQQGALVTRASSLAFKFFLALFPAMIFLFTLLPYIPIEDFTDKLLIQLQFMLPEEAYQLSKDTVEDLAENRREGLLSFGFLFTIYLATNGINAMIEAFNQSILLAEKRNFIMQRLAALALMFILLFLAIIAMFLIIFSNIIIDKLMAIDLLHEGLEIWLVTAGKWLVILGFFYFSVSFIYYVGPSRKEKFRFFSAGSSLATLLIIAVSYGFAYYVNHFGNYNKLYGSIGTLMVIMLWIYFNCLILLMGFELNASIMGAKRDRRQNHLGSDPSPVPTT
ncbi:MAG: YihY/virulence factor BrkB family protein [Salibacteraceae bacterium]